ncbi:MAG: VOC family protein, partial [Atopobiaceae bacterium]|nr:VOC family protein [Atopobiaceae bacterium]
PTLSISRMGDATEAMCLELMCDKKMDPSTFGGEAWHMGLRCEPIEEWHAFHEGMGVIIEDHPEMRMYFIADPDGNRIEFVPEKKPAS